MTPTCCRRPSISAGGPQHLGFPQEPSTTTTRTDRQDFPLAIADIAAYAHLTDAEIEALGHELDAIRRDIEDSLGARDAAYIRRTIRFQRTARRRGAPGHRLQPVPDRLGRRHRRAGLREVRREHGDRPQRRPRSMGLDERPGDPLDHVGVGHGRDLVAVEVLAQLPPPRVQQRRRRRRRPRASA